MVKIKRSISLNKTTNSFWFGPRQSGKSTLIRNELLSENFMGIDLLQVDLYNRYLKNPSLFGKDVEYQIKHQKKKFIFVDEIQKIPILTNEVHSLIEKNENRVKFILSGSSARKLKHGNANLLGGRAIVQRLFPFTIKELNDYFNLEQVLKNGSLAGIYFDQPQLQIEKLKAYVELYLKEEIAQEGLVRKLDIFNRFLDVAGVYATEIINYSNIARESETSVKTIQSYFQILSETLIGFELPCWDHSLKRQLSKHSKFYFVDNGILSAIKHQLKDPLDLEIRGKMFEQWTINEVRALLFYGGSEKQIYFWRTARGEHEVDLVLAQGNQVKSAIEIKAKKKVSKRDLAGLIEFSKEYPKAKLWCLSETPSSYEIELDGGSAIQIINVESLKDSKIEKDIL